MPQAQKINKETATENDTCQLMFLEYNGRKLFFIKTA